MPLRSDCGVLARLPERSILDVVALVLAYAGAELWFSLKLHAAAMLSFFTEGVFLFPLRAKLVAVAGILLVAIGGWRLVRRGEVSPGRYAFALTMIVLMPAAAHGANLILYPPYASLFERVLFSYAAVFLGIFVLACTPIEDGFVGLSWGCSRSLP